jgi:hypothetical protein
MKAATNATNPHESGRDGELAAAVCVTDKTGSPLAD